VTTEAEVYRRESEADVDPGAFRRILIDAGNQEISHFNGETGGDR